MQSFSNHYKATNERCSCMRLPLAPKVQQRLNKSLLTIPLLSCLVLL